MSRIRTFLAVEIPDGLRSRLVALQESLAKAGGDVRWAAPATLHVTMLFLGDVEDRELHTVCRAVAAVCAKHRPFPMTVEGVGCFPSPRRPRTIWAGVTEGAEQLRALHDALEVPLVEKGLYRREDRAFTPHLTIGRVRGEQDSDRIAAALAKHATWSGGGCEVGEVLVMASDLKPSGPVYSVMSTAALGESG